MDDIRTPARLREVVGALLNACVRSGTEFLPSQMAEVSFNLDQRVVEASALGVGDPFPAEMEELLSQHEEEQESTDLLAFRLAMALHRR